MITFFTTCKPFKQHGAIIQENALWSWAQLQKGCEIFVYGEALGVPEICQKLNLTHLPNTPCEGNLPLISGMFADARLRARNPILCYLNADILLPPHWLQWISLVRSLPSYLAVGYRTDVAVAQLFSGNSSRELWEDLKKNGTRHGAAGIDFFAFPKSLNWSIPPFVVGRPGWDNWMLWKARREGIPLIDLSPAFPVYHQNHSLENFARGNTERDEAPESKRNKAYLFHPWAACTLLDCNYEVKQPSEQTALPVESKTYFLRKKANWSESWQGLERIWMIYPDYAWFTAPFARLLIKMRKFWRRYNS